ncbi:MAG: response regulator transcription factor [Actinomycetota bacterium]
MNDEGVRLMLVDDHVMMREGLRSLLERQPDLHVVAEASSVATAVAAEADPQVIVCDLVMSDGRGADVVARIHDRFPAAGILVLTMVDDPADVHRCFAAGARGYMLKEAASTELTDAVRRVARGEDYLQPSMGAALAGYRQAPAAVHASASEQLSPREIQVLRLLAMGHTNTEIAAMLHLSLRTVESHRSSLNTKLGAKNRAELVRYAHRRGLVGRD